MDLVPFRRDEAASGEWESLRQYTQCHFHPVRPGDIYGDGRYRVIRKLGFGSYSTVWLTEEIRYALPQYTLIEG